MYNVAYAVRHERPTKISQDLKSIQYEYIDLLEEYTYYINFVNIWWGYSTASNCWSSFFFEFLYRIRSSSNFFKNLFLVTVNLKSLQGMTCQIMTTLIYYYSS